MSTTRTRPERSDPTTTARPRDLRALWRVALALLLPVPAVAMAGQILLSPYAVNASFPEMLARVAADPSREQLSIWAGFVFTLTVIPSVCALAWASRRRAPWLSLVGAVLALIGFTVGFCLPGGGAAALVAAQQALDPVKAIAISDAIWAEPIVSVSLAVFLAGASVGLLLLSLAMWRSRAIPRWMSVCLAVSVPWHLLGLGGTVGAAASWLLTAVGCLGATQSLLRMSDDQFDLPPGWASLRGAGSSSDFDARGLWRVLLAVSAPWIAVFVAVGRFLLPYDMSDQPRTIFEAMLTHPAYETAIAWSGVLLVPTCVSGVMAVAFLSRRRAPILTTIGLLLAYVGFVCLMAGDGFGNLIAQVVAQHPELDSTTAYALGHGIESSVLSGVTGTLFVFGHLIGTVILGIALWQARMVPSSLAIALAVSQPIHLISVLIGNRPLDLVGWGGTALGFAAAGWALLRMGNADFDLDPVVGRGK